ncbi:MAG TPA: preprotein translocase subunit SecE [Candidatus Bathyarchaeia archaeon]|nr:preprotein translocase subunit SecE [Candidatus Bathyarchaeia archaeon]
MAKQTTAAGVEAKPTLFVRVRDFYQDVIVEMSKVTWPSRDELKSSTSVVMFLLGVVAVIVYGYDIVFQFVVLGLLKMLGRA